MMDRRDPHGEREKMVFGEFLKAAPSIAQDAHSWSKSADEPYDIISQSANGLTVKWQLTQWLHAGQTQRSKERQKLTRAINNAVRGLQMPDDATCALFLQDDPPAHFITNHSERFREELLALAENVAAQRAKPVPFRRYTWPRDVDCWVLQEDLRATVPDRRHIGAWPVLVRYLDKVRFRRGEAPRVSRPAVSVMGFADSFREEDAVAPLRSCIENKMRNYHWPTGQDVRLLVFYDEGWIHNSPIYAPLVRNAVIAAEYLRGVDVPFSRVYLIFGRSGEAYEVHPDFKRCT